MRNKSLIILALLATSVIAVQACRTANELNADTSAVNYADETPQILSPEAINAYKAALPKFAYDRIQTIVDDPRTFWYDKKVMIPSYQDTVSLGIIGCRKNSSGAGLIVPQGRKLFNQEGSDFSFPFGHTAGTDNSTNVVTANFMSLPTIEGSQQPIVFYVQNTNISNLGVRRWRWIYPVGTTFGELIYVKDGAGKLYLTELRTRERHLKGWATNSFRPFPTAESLAAAVKARRPNFKEKASLTTVVSQLESPATLKARTLNSPAFKGVFAQDGAVDELPDFGDEALVRELLTETTFVSAYGSAWKSNGSLQSFAPTTKASFSIVPNNNDIGMIEVRDESCVRCHQDAQRPIMDFAPDAILYGDIWGSDQIFSFHPFDQTICTGAGDDQRQLRPALNKPSFIQKYDPTVHTKDIYSTISKY